jgi:pyruvate kinase
MRRQRHGKIIATRGPASSDLATIRALFDAGADVFRLNFSHGSHAQHREMLAMIRDIEREVGGGPTPSSPSKTASTRATGKAGNC